MDRYVVIGNPIAHSRSPRIHQLFAEATGQALIYERCLAPREELANCIELLRRTGVLGANVTLPFKEQAFRLCNQLSEGALRAGAVNTLDFRGPDLMGHNTDGAGLVRDLEFNLAVKLRGLRVLMLGAGGAARGVLGPLLNAGVREVLIWNRSVERAVQLVKDFTDNVPTPSLADERCRVVQSTAELSDCDVVINATSAGLSGAGPAIPALVLKSVRLAYDMAYGDAAAPFLRWAQSSAAQCSDGLGMLVEQAAEAFLIWRGVRPPTAAVLRTLRAEMS